MERSCGDRTVMMNGRPVRYIDPLSDWGFKRLFGTEVNKDFLRAFLQDLFPDKEISDITYMKPENQGLTRSDRQAVFDVACRTVGGERFIVEMQKRNQERFRERCLYYATFPIQEQAVKGDWNYSMSPVYMVSIMDFELIHDVRNIEGNEISGTDKRIFRYSLREDNTGELMTDRLKFVFIEIGNFSKEAEELVTGTDKWMYVLKNLARLTDRPAGLQERIFIKLFEAAEIAAFSPEERKQYEHDMMTENDYRNTIEFAKNKAREEGMHEGMRRGLDEGMQKGLNEGMQKGLNEGMQRGLNEGMQRGLNEGMQKGLMTAAAGMKKMGMGTDAIARATGLSREAVEQL